MPITVPARCCGPKESGNGGWVSGAVAALLPHHHPSDPATVSLRQPPPLEVALDVEIVGEGVRVTHGGEVVAEAEPGAFEHDPPAFVPPEVATEAAERYAGFVEHAFPHCLTCGTAREVGDGLRIFPGAVIDDGSIVAAPFRAGDLPDAVDGRLPEPMVWAALDCTTAWPTIPRAARPMLLARMTAATVAADGVPATDLISIGEARWSEGRKHVGTAALYDAHGTLLARSEALWVELR